MESRRLEAILIGRSRVEPKVALLKPVSSAISIGTGGPFGAEGPIIMTGGAVGSLVAQLFHLSSAERKTLLVAGAAAGMSAIFATPMAAVLLAVELLLFEWKPRSFIPVAVASAPQGAAARRGTDLSRSSACSAGRGVDRVRGSRGLGGGPGLGPAGPGSCAPGSSCTRRRICASAARAAIRRPADPAARRDPRGDQGHSRRAVRPHRHHE